MRDALARHDEILRDAVERRRGHVVKTTGDGLHAAFATAHDAVATAVDAQRALTSELWTLAEPLQVRMGIHTGEADLRDGDYYGTAVNRAARVAAVAHGGQIVCSHATEELVRDVVAADIGFVDLGTHQLRDLARPEHVFQIRADGLRADFPPLRSLDAFPGNLPSRPTSFVGRDTDLSKIAGALERSPIVTITGVGGVGKTRLALQVAAEIVPHYRDGAWFCELAAADSPGALVQVIAVTLGVPLRTGADPVDSVIEFIKAKDLLLVLDNCEHLIEAAGTVAERVVQSCPDVRVIATSREGLAVEGEQVVPLRSLHVPDDGSATEQLAGTPAVQLFVERARAARSDYELRTADLSAVAEICRRLDGIPLAIELAAARVIAMAPAEIAGLLDERFRLLTGGRRTAVERHQTLRATVDWSYSLLDERDRTVFDRLGVFAGTFGTDAAAAVVSSDGIERFDVLDALSDLVAKSLVIAEPAEDGTTRYVLLETLRQYSRERLDAEGTSDDWRRRHAGFYADFAEAIEPMLFTADEIAARRSIHTELDNLRAAVSWALDRDDRDDNELGVRIAAALSTEGAMGRATGVSEWSARSLPFVETTTPARRFQILTCVAWNAHAEARMDECAEMCEAIVAEPIPDDVYYCCGAHLCLAGAHAMRGDVDAAVAIANEGIALAESRDAADVFIAFALAVVAMHQLANGRFEPGRRDAERAAEMARRSRNPSALVLATYALGWSLSESDPAAADVALSQTIELCEAGAIDAVLAPSLCLRALLWLDAGRYDDAVPDIRSAFERSVEIVDGLTIGAAAQAAVLILAEGGFVEQAEVILGAIEANVIFNFSGSGYGMLDVSDARARVEAIADPLVLDAACARGAALTYDEAVAFVRGALADLAALHEPAV